MILTPNQLKVTKERLEGSTSGSVLTFTDLCSFVETNKNPGLFSVVEVQPGDQVDYHIHEGEFEIYYILSGSGLYNENGKETQIYPGTVTYNPSGNSHSFKNNGSEKLVFIALIIKE